MKKWMVLIPCIIAAAFYTITYADDASLGRFGDTVRPINDSQIVMESEYVNAKYNGSSTDIQCEFNFKNPTNSEITILMGFPMGTDKPERERRDFADDTMLHDFKTVIDGQEVPVRIEKGFTDEYSEEVFNYPEWYTWDVKFKPGESKKILNSYRVKNYYNSIGQVHLGYVLITGSVWDGKIGYAKINFDMGTVMPYQIESVAPSGYRFEGNDLIWEISDFEPEENIKVIFRGDIEAREFAFFPYESGAYKIAEEEQKGNYQGALELTDGLLQTSGKFSGDNIAFLYRKKYEYMNRLGRSAAAVSVLEKAIQEGYKEDGILYYLLKHYSETGNADKYAELYNNTVLNYGGKYLTAWGRQYFKDRIKNETAGDGNRLGNTPEIKDFSFRLDSDKTCEVFFTAYDEDGNLISCDVSASYGEENNRKILFESWKSFHGGVKFYDVKHGGGLPLPGSTVEISIRLADSSAQSNDKKIYYLYTGEQLVQWKHRDISGLKIWIMDESTIDWTRFGELYKKILTGMIDKLGIKKGIDYVRIYPHEHEAYVSKGRDYIDTILDADTAQTEQWIRNTVFEKAARQMLADNFGDGWNIVIDDNILWISEYIAGEDAGKNNELQQRLAKGTKEKFVSFVQKVGESGNIEIALSEIYGSSTGNQAAEDGFSLKLATLAFSGISVIIFAIAGIFFIIKKRPVKPNSDV